MPFPVEFWRLIAWFCYHSSPSVMRSSSVRKRLHVQPGFKYGGRRGVGINLQLNMCEQKSTFVVIAPETYRRFVTSALPNKS